MKILKALKNFVFFGATFYTVISTGFILIANLMSDSHAAILLEAEKFMYILLFSFIMSLGSTLLRIDEIGRVAAVISHAACYLIGFFVFVLLCGIKFAPAVIATVIFAVFYTVSTVVCRLISKRHQKKPDAPKIIPEKKKQTKAENTYQSQFTK